MSSVLLLFFILLAFVMLSTFAEYWYQIEMEIVGWWISQKNFVREKLIYPFKQRFSLSMVIPASSQRNDYLILYYIAKDFLRLTYSEKFRVGLKMQFLTFDDASYLEEQIDYMVLRQAVAKRKLSQLVTIINQVRYEQG